MSIAPTSAFSSSSRFGSSAPSTSLFDSHIPDEEAEVEDEAEGEDGAPDDLDETSHSPPISPNRRPAPPVRQRVAHQPVASQAVSPGPDEWMELDDDTRQLLQRSNDPRSHQAMDEEAFLWSDPSHAIKAERSGGQAQLAGGAGGWVAGADGAAEEGEAVPAKAVGAGDAEEEGSNLQPQGDRPRPSVDEQKEGGRILRSPATTVARAAVVHCGVRAGAAARSTDAARRGH